MGTFSNKIVAKFWPPKTWVLEDELSFETNELNDKDIEILQKIGANVIDTGKGTGQVTCRKGMQTDLASVPRACWALISPWDVARAAIIHDHLYAALRSYCNKEDYSYDIWKKGKDLSDTIFLLGMKSADPKVPAWKIYPAYWAVRLFGSWSAK